MTMDQLREWGAVVTAEELAGAMDSMPHAPLRCGLGMPCFEGPAYADRVGGRLTFRDWGHWAPADQAEWRTEYESRRPRTL
jgi:hypothetical protein